MNIKVQYFNCEIMYSKFLDILDYIKLFLLLLFKVLSCDQARHSLFLIHYPLPTELVSLTGQRVSKLHIFALTINVANKCWLDSIFHCSTQTDQLFIPSQTIQVYHCRKFIFPAMLL